MSETILSALPIIAMLSVLVLFIWRASKQRQRPLRQPVSETPRRRRQEIQR